MTTAVLRRGELASLGSTRRPLRKAKRATADRPAEILTDGMMAYPLAVSKEFGKMGGPKGCTNPHRRVPSIRAAESNNRIERLHGTEKERPKVCARSTRTGARR